MAWKPCSGVDSALCRVVIHRDMKPDNVFLLDVEGDHDFVKVLDFGIAKFVSGTMKHRSAGADRGRFTRRNLRIPGPPSSSVLAPTSRSQCNSSLTGTRPRPSSCRPRATSCAPRVIRWPNVPGWRGPPSPSGLPVAKTSWAVSGDGARTKPIQNNASPGPPSSLPSRHGQPPAIDAWETRWSMPEPIYQAMTTDSRSSVTEAVRLGGRLSVAGRRMPGLLEDQHLFAMPSDARRRGQAADPGADDEDGLAHESYHASKRRSGRAPLWCAYDGRDGQRQRSRRAYC